MSKESINVDSLMSSARKCWFLNTLIFLICFGTFLALNTVVKRELETQESISIEEAGRYAAVQLGVEEVRKLRHVLHELANVFTGIMVTGGLLHQALKGDLRQRYTGEICTGGDRGAVLVREAREVLMGSDESVRGAVASQK